MSNKLTGVLIAAVVILLAIVVGGGAYIATKDDSSDSSKASTSQSSSDDESGKQATRDEDSNQPLATIKTSDENFEIQVTSLTRQNTGILAKMKIVNVCKSCDEEYGNPYDLGINFRESYMIDQTSGQKYEVLKDDNQKLVASDATDGNTIKKGASFSLFAQYTAPPAGAKVDLYLGNSVEPITGLNIK